MNAFSIPSLKILLSSSLDSCCTPDFTETQQEMFVEVLNASPNTARCRGA